MQTSAHALSTAFEQASDASPYIGSTPGRPARYTPVFNVAAVFDEGAARQEMKRARAAAAPCPIRVSLKASLKGSL